MKVAFIPGKYTGKIEFDKKIIDTLPKQISLGTTIQYLDFLKDIKKQLENSGIKVEILKGEHSKIKGQVLGCDIPKVDYFLYIGDGLFHPKMAMIAGAKKTFCYNPKTKQLTTISKEDIKSMEQKKKAGLVKFYMSENIGILVTTKWGQERLKQAIALKNKIEAKGKKAQILIADTMNFDSLIDFNYIDCFVNTMCPRIGYDDAIRLHKPIVDFELLDL